MVEPSRKSQTDSRESERQQKPASRAARACLTIWAVIGGLILVVALGYLMNITSVTVGVILWSVIIIFCLRSPVNYFESKGINRLAGTTIAFVIMFIVLLLLGLLLFSPVFGFGEQFVDLARSVPNYISAITVWANDIYEQYSSIFQNNAIVQTFNSLMKALGDGATQIASASANMVVSFGAGVANTCIAVGFAFVVSFWLLIELPGMGREVYRIFPDRLHEDLQMAHLSVTRIMGGYIKATLLQCALIGIFTAIIFAIVGIQNSVALGAITGLLNIIPIVGPWFGGALAAVAGIFVSPLAAVVALAGAVVVQHFVCTFISPKIMRDSVDIHPAVTLVVMTIGSSIGGLMGGLVGSLVGMLLSIPLVAVAKSFFVYYYEKRTGRRIVSEDGVFFRGVGKATDPAHPLQDATSTRAIESNSTPTEKKISGIVSGLRKKGDKDSNDAAAEGQEVAEKVESSAGSPGLDIPGAEARRAVTLGEKDASNSVSQYTGDAGTATSEEHEAEAKACAENTQ